MSETEKAPLMALSDALAGAVAKAGQAVVLVNGRARMPASGIVYAENFVLTADHVVERDEDIKMMLADGTEFTAQVAGRDPGTDLALLRVNGSGLLPAVPAEPAAKVGQITLSLGRPSSEGIQASLGVVSAVAGPARTGHGGLLTSYIRTDAIPYPGFSGGPLINAAGEVLGLNTSGLAHGASLAVPVEIAWQVAATLEEHGGIKRGYLGIRSQLVDVSAAMQNSLGREQPSGLLIMGVESGSPAESGGLMVGDILVGLNGEPVSEHDELVARLIGDLVGKPTPVEVLRGGQPTNVTVTIGEMQQEKSHRPGRRHGPPWRR